MKRIALAALPIAALLLLLSNHETPSAQTTARIVHTVPHPTSGYVYALTHDGVIYIRPIPCSGACWSYIDQAPGGRTDAVSLMVYGNAAPDYWVFWSDGTVQIRDFQTGTWRTEGIFDAPIPSESTTWGAVKAGVRK